MDNRVWKIKLEAIAVGCPSKLWEGPILWYIKLEAIAADFSNQSVWLSGQAVSARTALHVE